MFGLVQAALVPLAGMPVRAMALLPSRAKRSRLEAPLLPWDNSWGEGRQTDALVY